MRGGFEQPPPENGETKASDTELKPPAIVFEWAFKLPAGCLGHRAGSFGGEVLIIIVSFLFFKV